jgi:hypothetical protein
LAIGQGEVTETSQRPEKRKFGAGAVSSPKKGKRSKQESGIENPHSPTKSKKKKKKKSPHKDKCR